MRIFSRSIRIIILLAFLLSTSAVFAQDTATDITVIGSGIVAPLFEELADGEVNVAVTGTSTGFATFCAGEADITLANRTINPSEHDTCTNNTVEYLDLLIGHDIIALVANPAADFAVCLDTVQLNTIFAPSAQAITTNWNQVIAESPDTPLTLYLPGDQTATYVILDSRVEGDGIRSDVSAADSAEAIISAVAEDTGALGVVSLNETLAAGDTVKILNLDTGDLPGCQTPTAENVENNLYTAADKLYAYVNVASLSNETLAETLRAMLSAEAAEIVASAGFTAPTADAYEDSLALLEAGISGEEIIRAADDFTLPVGVAGQVSVGGAAAGFGFMQNTTASFNSLNPDITVNLNIEGEVAGFRRFCNGEIDLAVTTRALSADEAANCEANTITPISTNLGNQAVVLVANGASDYLTCLTTDQLTSVWAANAETQPTTWNSVDSGFPETDITLFTPGPSNIYGDLLLLQASGSPLALRVDGFANADPLYRAAATANVEGGLTYMSWSEYQRVLSNNQANITLAAVDSGSGCVAPNQGTITDGTYPLARPLQLMANQAALARPEVQALVWYTFSNENFTTLEDSGLIGIRFGDLTNIRAQLQNAFSEAEAIVFAASAVEATPEATAEAGAESTDEPAAEATEAATEEPAAEVTEAATAEATEAATEEASE